MMNFKQLRYFVTLAEEKHFGRAAEKLNIVQPALSMQIKSLEETLGGAVFNRNRHSVELTQAGALLLKEARQTLSQANHTLKVVQDAIAGVQGKLRIGFVGHAVFSGVLVKHLKMFHYHAPDVEIQLIEKPPTELKDALQRGNIDLVYSPVTLTSDDIHITSRLLFQPSTSLIMHSSHPLAKNSHIDINLMKDINLILLEPYPNKIDIFHPMDINWEGIRVLTANSSLGVMAMVAANIGVALAPSNLSPSLINLLSLVQREFKYESATMNFSLSYRTGETLGTVKHWLSLIG